MKYRVIHDQLQAQILGGALTVGQRLPGENDLARIHATTRTTVAKALDLLEQSGLIERRQGAGTFVRQPQPGAGLRFGLLIPGYAAGGIFEAISAGIAEKLRQRGHHLWWGTPHGSDHLDWTETTYRHLIATRPQGIFLTPLELSPAMASANARIIEHLRAAGITVQLLDSELAPWPARSPCDLVGIDNRRAGGLVAAHLIASGRRRPAWLEQPHSAATTAVRRAGADAVFCAAGLPPCHVINGPLVQHLRAMHCDALLCANDATAATAMHALIAAGVGVPEEVAITGFDDDHAHACLPVPLTTIRQPCAAIAAAAVSTMLERLHEPAAPVREVRLDSHLVIRASSGGALQFHN